MDGSQKHPTPDVQTAVAAASKGEELYEEGRWRQAAERFEAAADAYVAATLQTSDTKCVQSLRLLAAAHSQRAHEVRLRMKLHNLHASFSESSPTDSHAALASRPSPKCGATASAGTQRAADATATDDVLSGALARLSSQLISALEELRFGAEDLARTCAPPVGSGSGGISG